MVHFVHSLHKVPVMQNFVDFFVVNQNNLKTWSQTVSVYHKLMAETDLIHGNHISKHTH